MCELGHHRIVPLRAGLSTPPGIEADVIVSHIVLSWKNLPFLFQLRARNVRTPMIHMEHSYSPAFEKLYVASPVRFGAMLTVGLSLFDRVISISSAQQQWLKDKARLSDSKIVLIPPFVDLTDFLKMQPRLRPAKRIGAIGRLDPQKGFDILIPAFREAAAHGLTLEIFGDGPERQALEKLSEMNPAITFHGHVDDPVAAMESVDIIAMPSRREPYGLVAIEALAAGRTLLVSRVDGLVDHAHNGAIAVDRLIVTDWAAALKAASTIDDRIKIDRARGIAELSEGKSVIGWKDLLDEIA
jgi:glycosyltransferase involved in cell wall biosynthesis